MMLKEEALLRAKVVFGEHGDAIYRPNRQYRFAVGRWDSIRGQRGLFASLGLGHSWEEAFGHAAVVTRLLDSLTEAARR